MTSRLRPLGSFFIACALVASFATPARADEIWVPPSSQADLGGLGIASNTIWPVTPIGAVRFAWAIPDNLQAFQSAKLVLIPHAPAAGALNVFVCRAQDSDLVGAACTGPTPHAFAGATNELVEVDVSAAVGPQVGAAGLNYLAVLAYTTPTTLTDHIVGLRFAYVPTAPGADTIGTAQVINNSLTAADLAPNSVTASELAADSVGTSEVAFNYAASTSEGGPAADLACVACVAAGEVSFSIAGLGANTFSGTQTIDGANLDLDASTATQGNITKNGVPFLHNRGTRNTFLGISAGNVTLTGEDNTAIGSEALNAIANGVTNTAVGSSALKSTSSGGANTAVGYGALEANATGAFNTGLGVGALIRLTSGSSNTALGSGAGNELVTGSGNLYIDGAGVANESNTTRIGDSQTRAFIRGIRGVTTGNPNAVSVFIDSVGQLGTVNSSRRFKEDIRDMAGASRRLLQLRPVTFRYKQTYGDGSKPVQFGLVAEEVAEVFPELAVRNADGQVETVHYETLNVLLLNELQDQVRRNDEQQRRIEALERQRDEHQQQQRRIEVLEQRMNERRR